MMELLLPKRIITKIVVATCVKAGTGSAIHRSRASHGLAMIVDGGAIYRFSTGVSIPIYANEIIYLPKHSDYDVERITPPSSDCWAINFDTDTDFIGTPQKWHVAEMPEIWDKFQIASELWLKGGAFSEWKIMELLYGILYALAQLSADPIKKQFARISPGVNYLESHYTDPGLTITMLANLCDVSDTYFRRIFNEQFHVSPLKYLINKRLNLAEELLASNLYSVTDVWNLCGYSDAVGFSNAFKKHTGISPKQYMKNHRG